jgi:hypothetical protein
MDESPGAPFSLNTTLAALGGVIVGAIGFATAVATGWFEYAGKDQELRVHLVEIAVSILRADPKEDVGAARGWALDIMEKNSGVPFSADDRASLLHKPLKTVDLISKANEKMFEDWDAIVKEESLPAPGPTAGGAADYFKNAAAIAKNAAEINAQAYRIKQALDAAEAARQRDKLAPGSNPPDPKNPQ